MDQAALMTRQQPNEKRAKEWRGKREKSEYKMEKRYRCCYSNIYIYI